MQGETGIVKIEKSASSLFFITAVATIFFAFLSPLYAQSKFDKRPIGNIEIRFGENDNNTQLLEEFRLTAHDEVGSTYSASRIRAAIEALYATKKIETITVAASNNANGNVDLVFNIKRKIQAQKVS